MLHTLASRNGGFKAEAVNADFGTLDTLQVQVGRFTLLAFAITSAFAVSEVGVTDVLPGLLTIENALLDLVDGVRLLHTDQNLISLRGFLFDLGKANQTTGQQVVVFVLFIDRRSPVFRQSVDDQSTVQDRTGVFFVQRHQRGDQVDVGARRFTGERLDI